MSAITGRVENGLVILDEPASLAEGSRVVVQPLDGAEPLGVSESQWQDTPEAIADWIAWYDSLEPIILSPDDEQSMAAYRQRQHEIGKSAFDERADRVRKIWQ